VQLLTFKAEHKAKAVLKSSSAPFFSFLLSRIVLFENLDMVRKVDEQEHHIVSCLLCHVVYNSISRCRR